MAYISLSQSKKQRIMYKYRVTVRFAHLGWTAYLIDAADIQGAAAQCGMWTHVKITKAK